ELPDSRLRRGLAQIDPAGHLRERGQARILAGRELVANEALERHADPEPGRDRRRTIDAARETASSFPFRAAAVEGGRRSARDFLAAARNDQRERTGTIECQPWGTDPDQRFRPAMARFR